MIKRILFTPLAAMLFAAGAGMAASRSDSGAMETDRPGFMDALSVLPRSVAHLESGTVYSGASGARSLALGGHSLRIGVARRWEVRLFSDGYIRAGNGASGWAGGSAGAKVRLAGERRSLPAVSLCRRF